MPPITLEPVTHRIGAEPSGTDVVLPLSSATPTSTSTFAAMRSAVARA